jgi:hypothetical protein
MIQKGFLITSAKRKFKYVLLSVSSKFSEMINAKLAG